jgi:hypothetical protein
MFLAWKRPNSSTQQLSLAMHELCFRPWATFRAKRGMSMEMLIGRWRDEDALQREWVQHANAQLK